MASLPIRLMLNMNLENTQTVQKIIEAAYTQNPQHLQVCTLTKI